MTRELQLRIYSSIVMAAVVLAATWYGGYPFRLLAVALGLLIFHEWATLSRLAEKSFRGLAWGWASVAGISANLLFGSDDMAVPLLAGTVLTALVPLAAGRWSLWHGAGILYAGFSAIALIGIRAGDSRGFIAMIFVFAIVWSTDILAYFVGRAIGGPRLAPSISPGKTWSGAIGGTIAGLCGGMAVMFSYFSSVSPWTIAMAILLSVASQIGDLFESFVKRRFGAKDSSHLIPGHGGVMDRVDGLVFACFAAFLVAVFYSAATGRAVETIGGLLIGF